MLGIGVPWLGQLQFIEDAESHGSAPAFVASSMRTREMSRNLIPQPPFRQMKFGYYS
jgi:hypothetical protein